MPHFRNDNKE